MPSKKRYYIPRDRPIICDICGFSSYRLSEMRKGVSGSQKGLNVCPTDFDEVHPRDEKITLRPIPSLEYPV